ncbi:hypothetical protein MPSEU_000613500 [Mayamaea pseudoterrestris]|nr:hypothetical protein MPSEU_000613500 [Mayamaea pseudoterrestris]
MGSTQSLAVQKPSPASTLAPSDDSSSSQATPSSTNNAELNSNENLSGMELVNHKCARKKNRYEKCSSDFYKEFLTGKKISQAEACDDKYQAYRTCVLKGIKIEVWDKQGLPPLKEGSPLLEVVDDD